VPRFSGPTYQPAAAYASAASSLDMSLVITGIARLVVAGDLASQPALRTSTIALSGLTIAGVGSICSDAE
jgi:hypothetical protein